jgi:hypothetical protein
VDVVHIFALTIGEEYKLKTFIKKVIKEIILVILIQKKVGLLSHYKYLFQNKQLEADFAILHAKKKLKKVYAILISTLLISTISSTVMAVTEDNVIINFDPDGNIDIDISLASYNFSGVMANQWSNTTGNVFTIYNNGTISMDTRIKTNATTDEGDMTLDAVGTPGQDEYSIQTNGFDSDGFLDSSYGGDFDTALGPNDSKGFDICLLIGTNLSSNYSWQTTTITFQGTQS